MLTAIFVILIVAALGVIGWIIIRNLPQLSLLNPDQSPREKTQRLKKNIIVERILRKARAIGGRVAHTDTWRRIPYLVENSYAKLKILEETYKARTKEAKINLLLKRGNDSLTEDPELAERCFLDVIALDARSPEAYEGLFQIYLQRKNFPESLEIMEFLTRINPGAAGRYLFELASAYQMSGETESAGHYARQAIEYESFNPKYLDFLVENAILGKDSKGASKYLKQLKKANPDNAKIEEFEERIKNLATGPEGPLARRE